MRRPLRVLVTAALAPGGTLAEVTARAYPEVPPPVLPVAERSCLAIIQKLVARGRARVREDRFEAA